MTPIIIALLILAIGAAVLIVAGIFTAKLLQKRKEGLDRRQADIAEREEAAEAAKPLLDTLSMYHIKLIELRTMQIHFCGRSKTVCIEITADAGG